MSDNNPLHDLDRTRKEVRQFLHSGAHDDWFINKTLRSEVLTEKAFALFYLSPCLSPALGQGFDHEAVAEAIQDLEQTLKEQQKRILEHRGESIKNTALGVLPNSYASAVLVAGYLRAVNNGETAQNGGTAKQDELNKITTAVETAITWMTGEIIKPEGFIPSLYAGSAPSSYLTFWCVAAVCQWLQYLKKHNFPDNNANSESLRLLLSWSGRRLRDMLAFHHGGLRSQFDVIEAVYASAALLMASENSDDRILVEHALSVLFESYFNSGCLEASAPVFTDVTNLSVQISTVEALATIFLADGTASIMSPHLNHVKSIYEWLRNHGNPVKGWYPEGQGRANLSNGYATASATLVLTAYIRMIDDCLDQKVRVILGIGPFVQDVNLQRVNYPGDLRPLLKETVFDPIQRGDRNIASYSMVLYGPPGTSKTTIAKLVSQNLGWPLKKLGPGNFTHKGRGAIDQAAAEVFEALGYLKNIVVLFDEVEELVGKREAPQANMESRLLTTAMLPRLQELRDRREIVFILATNRVDNIDSAITRLGRFDIVRCVLPPSPSERQRILDELIGKYNLNDEVKEYFSELQVAEESERFCYGDLDAFAREIAIGLTIGKCTKDLIKRMFKHAQSRAITEEDLKPYIANMERFDRPGRRTT